MATLQEALDDLSDKSIRHIVNISGGKDSTALALYLRQEHPEIPAEYVFCDTGCELPETYEYLDRLEALLGEEIHRLNALDLLGVEHKPGRTPFDIWLSEVYGGFLPTPRSRWCTRVLKIQPFEQFVGDSQAYSYIGIRADEDRAGYKSRKPPVISERPNILPVYPLRDTGLTISDIHDILSRSGLGLPDYYRWRTRSGCYFCFYQQLGEWRRLAEEHPDLFNKAMSYEGSGQSRFQWNEDWDLATLATLPLSSFPLTDAEEDGCAICHL